MDNFLFPSRMIKTCWFTTLHDLRYRTTVSIQSPSRVRCAIESSLHLSLSIFDVDGSEIFSGLSLGELKPGDRFSLDVDEVLKKELVEGDVVGALHMTPHKYANVEMCDVSSQEIEMWTSACDEFIGYYHVASGVSSGVHYQSPPMNDSRFRSSGTMIIQSPKVVVSDRVDSHLLIFSPSSDPDFTSTILLQVAVLDTAGEVVARGKVSVPARGRRRLSISSLLDNAEVLDSFKKSGGFGMLVGLTTGGVVTPLSLVHDIRGGLAVDHTLPPPYYVPWWGGEVRRNVTEKLISDLFPQDSNS